MSKPFIQVGDSFFKVIQDLGGKTDIIKIKPEEAIAEEMEKIVLTDSPDDTIQVSLFQEIIDKARNDLKSALETNLKSTVLASLGFSKDSWNEHGWRVDHCNGRMSAVTSLISHEVQQRLLQVEIGKDFTLTDSEKEQLQLDMKKEFKTAYRNKIRDLTWKNAENLASEHVNQFVSDLTKNKIQEIATAMLEKTLKNAR